MNLKMAYSLALQTMIMLLIPCNQVIGRVCVVYWSFVSAISAHKSTCTYLGLARFITLASYNT